MNFSGKAGNWAAFLLKNVSVPLIFAAVFRLFGAKPAIGFAAVATALQLLIQWVIRSPISPIFLVASAYTIGFGTVDLLIENPRYFRFEPALQNFTIGLAFLGSLVTGRPIVAWFEKALPESLRKDPALLGPHYYFYSTLAWGLYFLFKTVVFYYAALELELDMLVGFRSVFGGLTLAAMFGGEIWIRKRKYARDGGKVKSPDIA